MFLELLNSMKEEYIDGMFINNSQNVHYVSNHTGNNAYAIITLEKKYLITDARYAEQASYESPDFEIIIWDRRTETLTSAIDEIVKKSKINRLGFEAEYISYSEFTELFDGIHTEITPVIDIVGKLREIKSKNEIEFSRIACEITERAFSLLLKDIKVGMTEIELSARAGYYLQMEGGDATNSENIVLAGHRTSIMMDKPSKNMVNQGDLILINIGAKYNGYGCDFTRTVVLGKPSDKQVDVYNEVMRSQISILDRIKANILGREAYAGQESIISKSKYGEYFLENIGHGIGLSLHEEPYIHGTSDSVIRESSIMTVEPGIYIPRWGGIRLEDQILVKEDGFESLTKTTKELIVL